MPAPIPSLLSEYAAAIDAELDRLFREAGDIPSSLREAMAYSACGGGKRFRGALALGACVAVGGRPEQALSAACALEMAHAFSLVHDDLPCMDNSDLRRGKPSSHRVHGEAMALLAGDALLVQGLIVLVSSPGPPARVGAAVGILLDALGPAGMIGGQVLDMEAERRELTLDELRAKDAAKTGALIRAAARIGGVVGGGSEEEVKALDDYAAHLGLAFQIVDDILDLTGDPAALGKPRSDERNGKATYPILLGVDRARELAAAEIDAALAALAPFGGRGAFLAELARFVGDRDG